MIFFNQYCAVQDRHRIRNRLADKLLSLKQHLIDVLFTIPNCHMIIFNIFFFSDVIYFFNVSSM